MQRTIFVCLLLAASFCRALAGDLKVTWEPNTEPDLAGYFVYYGPKSKPQANRIDVGRQTEYLIQNLTIGETYYISVTAADQAGNESLPSELVSARVVGDLGITLEAENMPIKTTGSARPPGWGMWSNGQLAQTVNFPRTDSYRFTLRAYGSIAAGEWSKAELRIDQVARAVITVNTPTYAEFTATFSVTTGAHQVAIAFINDLYNPPEDRNLWVDWLKIQAEPSNTQPPVISNVNANNITASSATITWNTDKASDSQVEYGLTASYGTLSTLDTAMVNSHSVMLSSLQPNTTYHYRVKSKDAAGNLAVSGNFTLTTLPDVTPPVISNVAAGNITTSAATITWNTNEASDSQVEYGLTASYGSSSPLDAAMVTLHSVTLSNLQPNTTYHYRVKSKDAAGNLAVSGNFTLTTLPDVTPPVISNVAAGNITTSAATITWNTNETSDSQVEYGLTASYGSSSPLDAAMVNSHSVTLSNLQSNTTYHYRVKSKDAAGNLAVSDNFILTTLPDVTPPVISNVNASNITTSAATIIWNTNEASDSQVEYGLTPSYGTSSALDAAMVNSHTVTVSNLQANTTYHYRVKSKDAAGNLAVSPTAAGGNLTFTTTPAFEVTLEAESMPIKTTGSARPPGWGLWNNGQLAQTVNFPRTDSYRFILRAYGSIAAGEWSKAELRIDQVTRAVITVNTPTYAEFTATFNVTAGARQVAIAFVNDLYSPPEDRNLWVDWLKIQAGPGDGPPVISNVAAGNITASASTITWNTDKASDSQVEYGLTASYGSSSPLDVAMVNSHSVTLSNLQANTTYHYRVKSKDAAGNLAVSPTAAGGNLTFTTTPAFEVTLEAENMPIKTTGSARPPGWGLWNNGQLAQTVNFPRTDSYRFTLRAYGSIAAGEWSKAELRIDQVARAVITVNTPTYAEFTATFSVTAGAHQVAIAFINDLYSPPEDRNLWVDWLKIQAGPGDTQPPVISNVNANNTTASTATIIWNTDEASDSQVEFGLTTSYGTSSPLDAAMLTSHSVTLSNLQPNTMYHYRVKSKDAAGNLAVSGNFTLTTLPDVTPPVISNVNASSITASTANINWLTNEASDSQVEYGLTPSYGSASTLDAAMVTSHTVTVSNLQANTTYHYRVKSKDAAGNLAVSPTAAGGNFTFTTTPAFEVTLEAENMPIKTTGSARPPGWGLWNDGQLAQTVNFPRTDSYRFILRAYGSIAAGEWSKAELRIDQVARAVITVNTPTYAEFTATFNVTAGARQVAIAFVNDLYSPPDDRNLWVDWLKIQAAPPNNDPLAISNVNASNITGSTATITWITNKPSDSQVEYGLTPSYGASSPLNARQEGVTAHSVTLSNLQANTTYHYRVKSKEAAGNLATSAAQTFQTSAPATPVGVLAFTDITLAAGAGGPAHADSTGGHAAGFADVDNDGQPDLYISMYNVPENPTNDLFFRNVNGRVFSEEGAPRGIADYDGGSHGVAFADLDNDGDYDLYNGTTRGATGVLGINNIYRNNGNGFFTDVSGSSGIPIREWETRAAIAFDMDGDGDLDLFCVTDYLGSDDAPEDRNEVYRNDGGLRFTAINDGALFLARAGQGATDTDFDGDGDVDVIAANRSGEVNLLRNDGNGNFTQISPLSLGITHRAGDGITMADIDNDGDLDMLLASDNEGYLYRNNGAGFSFLQRFTETDGYMGGFADLDNDGDVDLLFAGDDVCYLNNGSGIFTAGPRIPVAGIGDPRGIGFADIDNDGDVDFAVGCKRSRNWLIRNDFNAGNWLKIRLISPQGQAGAFGAKTRIYPANQAGGALVGMRESRCNNGYLGQDDPVLHFGLGQLTAVDVVTTFLDGITVTQRNVAAGQTITIDGRTGDQESPVISNVAVANITSSSAVVSWTTNERSDSQVEYGLTAGYGLVTTLDPARVTSHVVMLAGLQANTLYHYRVKSKDAAGNLATSNNFTFTTGSATTLLADDFAGSALDANKWNRGANAGNQSLVTNSRLELRSQGAETGWVITRNAYVAKNTIVSVKAVQPNSDGDLGISPTFNLSSKFGIYDEPNWYRFYTYRNANSGPYRLFVQWKKNGAEGGLDVTGSLLINGAVYLRLRFDNTQIHFEASLDSVVWSNTYGEPFSLPGYTLSSRFYYELAGYNTGAYGVLAVDDFSIIQTGASSVSWGGVTKPDAPDDAPMPSAFALQNYPNPFNAATRIRFALPQDSEIELTVFDLGGRLVHELFNGSRSAGNHEMIWDGRNREGNELSSGIYLVRLRYRAEEFGDWSQLVQRVTMTK